MNFYGKKIVQIGNYCQLTAACCHIIFFVPFVFSVFKIILCVSVSLRSKNIIFWNKFSGHRR